MHGTNNIFADSSLGNLSDDMLSDTWNWCVLEGCRTVTMGGKLYMKKGRLEKFR